MRRSSILALLAATALLGLSAWYFWPSEEREIRRRLEDFTNEFNASMTDGLGTVARAARLGSFFTDDVVVEFGAGSPPIQGRDTLIGMAARLQPRTAAFSMELRDVNVAVGDQGTADVSLTTVFRRRSMATGEESLDAREFALELVNEDGQWKVRRVRAVEALK